MIILVKQMLMFLLIIVITLNIYIYKNSLLIIFANLFYYDLNKVL